MPFQLSPGVAVIEKDYTSIVPAVSSSTGGFAGVFQWGPVLDPVNVSSENVLVQRFGKPNTVPSVYRSFWTAANFLGYTSSCLTIRVDGENYTNSVSNGADAAIKIKNQDDYLTNFVEGGNYRSRLLSGVTVTGSAGQLECDEVVVHDGDLLVISGTDQTAGGDVNPGTYLIEDVTYTTVNDETTVSFSYTELDGTAVSTTQGAVPTNIFTVKTPIGGWAAKYPGSLGNSIGVSMADAFTFDSWDYKTEFDSAPGTSDYTASVNGENDELHVVVVDTLGLWTGSVGAVLEKFAFASKASDAKKGDGTNSYYKSVLNNNSRYVWWMDHPTEGFEGNAFANDIVLTPASGTGAGDAIAGTAGQIGCDNTDIPGINVVNVGDYIVVSGTNTYTNQTYATGVIANGMYKVSAVSGPAGERTGFTLTTLAGEDIETTAGRVTGLTFSRYAGTTELNWGTTARVGSVGTIFDSLVLPTNDSLAGGVDDFAPADGDYTAGFGVLSNAETYDVSLIPCGAVSSTVANYVIENVALSRLDCVAFVSPSLEGNNPIIGSGDDAAQACVDFRNDLTSTSYAVLDSGWKYQYDRYNDEYRWIPLCGDIAGLCARTDYTNDPWFSPGGYNRGQIKNVVKLAFNPGKTERDTLYKNGVNPVVSFPGQGTILYGDKTLQAKPSAFDRINVRRLFIVLEKAISTAAKYQLFEFNDSFTRAQFKNMVEPFLRDVQGRRGVIDFVVKCDESNNTGEVIDRNEFVADIFIKPARSINFITLNFIAARTSVNFSEIGG